MNTGTITKHVALRCGGIAHPKMHWVLERLGAGVLSSDRQGVFRDSWVREPLPDDRYRLLVGRPGAYRVAGRWQGSVPVSELASCIRCAEQDLEDLFRVAQAVTRKPDGRLTGETVPAVTILEMGGD
jgi:hypothetical protein